MFLVEFEKSSPYLKYFHYSTGLQTGCIAFNFEKMLLWLSICTKPQLNVMCFVTLKEKIASFIKTPSWSMMKSWTYGPDELFLFSSSSLKLQASSYIILREFTQEHCFLQPKWLGLLCKLNSRNKGTLAFFFTCNFLRKYYSWPWLKLLDLTNLSAFL